MVDSLENKIMNAYNVMITRLEQVIPSVSNGTWRYSDCPFAVVTPMDFPFTKKDAEYYTADMDFQIAVMVRETIPENWMRDVMALLSKAVTVMCIDDPALGNTAVDCHPAVMRPAQIDSGTKLYWGGIVVMRITIEYP